MMGNAAIQAAERARDLLAEAVGDEARGARGRGWSSPSGRVFDAEDPETRRDLRRGGRASPRRRSARSARSAPTRRRRRAGAVTRARGVGPSPAYSYTRGRRRGRGRSRDRAGSTVPKVWIAHDIGQSLNPVLVRGQVEGSVYMGLGEALMEEKAFRRLPPRLSHALVHKFPSMLEYKSPTTLDMPRGRHLPRRGPGSRTARSAPRRSARGRCCRSCRRSPTRSSTRSACASTRSRSRPRRS